MHMQIGQRELLLEGMARYLVGENKMRGLREVCVKDQMWRNCAFRSLLEQLRPGRKIMSKWLCIDDIGDRSLSRDQKERLKDRIDQYVVCRTEPCQLMPGLSELWLCGPGDSANICRLHLNWLLSRIVYILPESGGHGLSSAPGLVSINSRTLPLFDDDENGDGSALSLWRTTAATENGLKMESMDPGKKTNTLYLPQQLLRFALRYTFEGVEDGAVPSSGEWTESYRRHGELMWNSIFGPGWLISSSAQEEQSMVLVAGNLLPQDQADVRDEVCRWLHDAWAVDCPVEDDDSCSLFKVLRSMRGHSLLCATMDNFDVLRAFKNAALDMPVSAGFMNTCMEAQAHRRQDPDMWNLAVRGHTQLDMAMTVRHNELDSANDVESDEEEEAEEEDGWGQQLSGELVCSPMFPESVRYVCWSRRPEGPYALFFVRYCLMHWRLWYVELVGYADGTRDILDLSQCESADQYVRYYSRNAGPGSARSFTPSAPVMDICRRKGPRLAFMMPYARTSRQEGQFRAFATFVEMREYVGDQHDRGFWSADLRKSPLPVRRTTTPDYSVS